VRICEERGGIGAILFGDPMDMAPKGENFVFPKSLYVGGSAMQRGSLDFSQDSETPGYPSIRKRSSLRVADPPGLPKIPAQVIGYDDARVLLKLLGGPDWAVKGGFNFTYRTGPFASSHKGEKVRLSVNNIIKRLVVHDVIGIIRGSVEPGQFSVTGNHHDAWGFGASDPSSATAALLEASRTLGAMVKRGWRPRRSIVVAFWAQEEVGRAGSREWVEENICLLTHGAVGYVNIDTCADGELTQYFFSNLNNLAAFQLFLSRVKHTTDICTLIYYVLLMSKDASFGNIVQLRNCVTSLSLMFYKVLNVLLCRKRSFSNTQKVDGVSLAPYYHTAYETLELYQRFVDPDYAIMERCSQLVGALTLSLAEAELLPYNMVDLGQALQEGFGDLQTHLEDFAAHN
ncbi:glutamate carboxypeptidase, putative, partial [Ixodes scapularis]